MSGPFSIPFHGKDPEVSRYLRSLEGLLNQDAFNERSFFCDLPGQAPYGYTLDNHLKANLVGFQSWYAAGMANGTALGTAAPAVNTLIAIPFVATTPSPVDGLAFEVTTASGANGKARVGIYSAAQGVDGTFYPRILIADGGDQVVSVGAAVMATTGLNVRLEVGQLHFAVYLAGTSAPTIRTIPVGGAHVPLGLPVTLGTAPQLAITVASTYAAVGLPNFFPAGGTAHVTALPAVYLRHVFPDVVRRSLPVWSPSTRGFELRRVRILSCYTVLQQTIGRYFTVSVGTKFRGDSDVISTYDSRKNKISAGEPFSLIEPQPYSLPIEPDTMLEVQLVQSAHPLQDLSFLRVQFDVRYTGA